MPRQHKVKAKSKKKKPEAFYLDFKTKQFVELSDEQAEKLKKEIIESQEETIRKIKEEQKGLTKKFNEEQIKSIRFGIVKSVFENLPLEEQKRLIEELKKKVKK